jgi:hypothetical protein
MARDNFPAAVKTALAKRAGYRCSYPGCPAITVGPSHEGDMAVANTGTAAHISAASAGKGSRRYDTNLAAGRRTSIENGIWCCRDHGTLIDADEITYSSVMLRGWRAIAEREAQLRQAHGDIQFTAHRDLIDVGLATEKLSLTSGFANSSVGTAVLFCCVAEIWGKTIADAVRDFLIEYARNAFEHAGAITVSVEFAAKGIVVKDDGLPFNLHTLAQASFGRGGGMAYRALLSALRINAISTCHNASSENVLHLPLVGNTRDLVAHNPCALAITHEQLRMNSVNFSSIVGCDRAFIVAPDFMTYSDGPWCEQVLQAAVAIHKNVSLVIPRVSAPVLDYYRKCFPNTEVLSW